MSGTDPTMAQPAPHHTSEVGAVTPRRGPDLLTLAVGLGAVGVAGTALLGGVSWLPVVDARWVLAAVALVVGVMLVIGSFRHPRR
ncbi:MAG: hypothetical protein M3228_10550 [Actinomycetota bacterium]|nr:hypothetical protein [Actinomycetota bacterium]